MKFSRDGNLGEVAAEPLERLECSCCVLLFANNSEGNYLASTTVQETLFCGTIKQSSLHQELAFSLPLISQRSYRTTNKNSCLCYKSYKSSLKQLYSLPLKPNITHFSDAGFFDGQTVLKVLLRSEDIINLKFLQVHKSEHSLFKCKEKQHKIFIESGKNKTRSMHEAGTHILNDHKKVGRQRPQDVAKNTQGQDVVQLLD